MYLLFTGMNYYPCGGWNDYLGRFDTLELAVKFLNNPPIKWEWAQVVDYSTCTVVWEE